MRIFWIGKLHGLRSTARVSTAGITASTPMRRMSSTPGSRLSNGRLRQNGAPDYEFGGQEFESLRARQLDQQLRTILPIDTGAIRLSRVHNQVHDRAASARGLVSNGPLSLPREFLRSYLAWGCS